MNLKNLKTFNIELDRKDLVDYQYKAGYLQLGRVRIDDKDNNTFTDAHLAITIYRGRVKVLISHEKGYPSEEKGITEKEITTNWISNELPKV